MSWSAARRLWDTTVGALLVFVLTAMIRAYQLTISPLLGPVCRYYPSCSHYGREAITVHRAGKGVLLTAWRLMRCNPWSAGGVDLVPARGYWPTRPSRGPQTARHTPTPLTSDSSHEGAPA